MALLMRAELAQPGMQFLSPEQYNQLFTMHGTIMLLFFATPIVFAFANFVVPLQIGAPDVSFPRLNAFAYWLYAFGGTLAVARLRHAGRRGRLRLVRLRAAERRDRTRRASAPTCGSSAWSISGLGTILGGGQHDHHDPDAARARHDDVPDADLHLEHPGHQPAGDHGLPAAGRRAARAAGRPAARRARLRPGHRRPDALAAPVLVLRPSRGLHRRAAVLRHHHRGHPGLQPQADLRLQGPGRARPSRSRRCR